MREDHWTALVSRIVPQDTDDLNDVAAAYDTRRGEAGRDIFPDTIAPLHCRDAFQRPDTVCVGLRVTEPLADAHDRALRLASLAAEQDVQVVVLTSLDFAGLERFGFRVERIAGDTSDARARCEEQIRQFWDIDLIL